MTINRGFQFVSKVPDGSVWPGERAYWRAKFQQGAPELSCGKFNMRIVPYPLRPLTDEDGSWELAGVGNEYEKGKRDEDNPKYSTLTRGTELDIAHVPIHLLQIHPDWRKDTFRNKRKIQRFAYKDCKYLGGTRKKRKQMAYKICLKENQEKYWIGKRKWKPVNKYNAVWTASIFNRKSKVFRLTLPTDDQLMFTHTGTDGAGAINKDNEVYESYRESAFLWQLFSTSEDMVGDKLKAGGDDDVEEDSDDDDFDKWRRVEEQNNRMISVFPLVFRAVYDSGSCPVKCQQEFSKWLEMNPYPFQFAPVKWASTAPAQRVGKVYLKFSPKEVNALSFTDGNMPNMLSMKSSVDLRLKLRRHCKFGGYCKSWIRNPFGNDGWDLFKGEVVLFDLVILTNEDSFRYFAWQNPLLTAILGLKPTLAWGRGTRSKRMTVTPRKGRLTYGTMYLWKYELTTHGAWHKWWLHYPKKFFTDKQEFEDSLPGGKVLPDLKGCTWSMYNPARPKENCDWGPLKVRYTQEWEMPYPEPGTMTHRFMDRMRFSRPMSLGETRCGRVFAKLQEWPANPKKNFVKLMMSIHGPQGGLVWTRDDDEANILRFPNAWTVFPPRKESKEKYCVTAKAPGRYNIHFGEPYGSIVRLFPNAPNDMPVTVALTDNFRITVDPLLSGSTLFNKEWSVDYELKINKIPGVNDDAGIDTDIVVTPTHEDIQFSPSKIRWSADSPRMEKVKRRMFRMRPLLDCAWGGVALTFKLEVEGMVTRITPYPLPAIQVRVKEEAPSPGCDIDEEAEEDEEFNPLEQELADLDDTVTETVQEPLEPKRKVVRPKSKITLVVALLVLAVVGIIIIALCAFGILGPTPSYEAQIAKQLRSAIMERQRILMEEKMTGQGMDKTLPDHYESNVDARKRLMEADQLFSS